VIGGPDVGLPGSGETQRVTNIGARDQPFTSAGRVPGEVDVDAFARGEFVAQLPFKRPRNLFREHLMPLEARLARLLKMIPSEIQAEGVSLSAMRASLRGRFRGHAHPFELGMTLRKLGFKRRRRWEDTKGFRAVWFRDQLEADATGSSS
jgi:hypothetical protein